VPFYSGYTGAVRDEANTRFHWVDQPTQTRQVHIPPVWFVRRTSNEVYRGVHENDPDRHVLESASRPAQFY
jgi:hypothetical protein